MVLGLQSFRQFRETAGALADPSQPDGRIVEVMESGYLRDGRLLRPAKVIVVKNA